MSSTDYSLRRTVVLIGLMGAGKSAIGKRLAPRLGVTFVDSDAEIAAQAGMSIPEIFATRGEADFRQQERDVIANLLAITSPLVMATGGGAFMDAVTRPRILQHASAVWLRADLELLIRRCDREGKVRPLLVGKDVRATLAQLMVQRYPVYAQAPMVYDCSEQPPEVTAQAIIELLVAHGDVQMQRGTGA